MISIKRRDLKIEWQHKVKNEPVKERDKRENNANNTLAGDLGRVVSWDNLLKIENGIWY